MTCTCAAVLTKRVTKSAPVQKNMGRKVSAVLLKRMELVTVGSGVCSAVLLMQKQTASAGVQFLLTEQLRDGGTPEKKFQCRQIARLQHSVPMAVFCMSRICISFVNSVLLVINELVQIKKAVIHITENGEVAAVPLTSAN